MSKHRKKNKKNQVNAAEQNAVQVNEAADTEEAGAEEVQADDAQAAEDVQPSEEVQTAEEAQTEEEVQTAEEAQTEEEVQTAEEAQIEETQSEAGAQSSEEDRAEEEQPADDTQASGVELDDAEREAIARADEEDARDSSEEDRKSPDDGASAIGGREVSKVSRNDLKKQSENERARREARHKRRIRQQVTAYVILAFIILFVGCGIFFGVKFIVNSAEKRREAAAMEEQVLLEEQQRQEEEAQALEEQQALDALPTVEDLGPTPNEQLDALITSEIGALSLEEKVQALMFVTPESITGVDRVVIAGEGTAAAFADFCPGGIIYSSKNITSADQFTTMIATTGTLVKRPVFYAIAETGMNESGLITSGVIASVQNPAQAAATGNVEEVVNAGQAIGAGLSSVGITVDLAPLADMSVTPGGVMANTSYGNDAAQITPYVTGMADGLLDSGVIPAYKYFPSLCASTSNPEYGRAVCDRSIDDFRNNEFQVWLSAINAGAQMIQMSNVIYPSIDADSVPSSLSNATVTGILRDELKYEGVIISGPLSDAAITSYYTASESAVMALKAGCDMICSSPDPRAAVAGIVEAVGSGVISEERINDALARIYRIRYADTLEGLRSAYEANAVSMGVDLTGVTY